MDSFTQQDRYRFWKTKYLKEHIPHMVITLVLSVAVVLLLRARQILEISDMGWAAVFLVILVFDLLHFNRQMTDYVRLKVMEEEQKERRGAGPIDQDDPRLVDEE